MVSTILGYIFLILTPFLVLQQKFKTLIFLSILSASSEILFIGSGIFWFDLIEYIAFCSFIFGFSALKGSFISLRLFWNEYLLFSLVGLFFLSFSPWDDPYASERLWTQQLGGRTLTGMVRLTTLFLIMQFFHACFYKYNITIIFLLKCFSIILLLQVSIGIIDIFLNGAIKTFLSFDGQRILTDRFTGLNVEPRVLGRILSIFLLTILTLGFSEENKLYYYLVVMFGIIGLLLTISTSAIVTFAICLIYLSIFYYKLSPIRTVFFALIFYTGFIFIKSSEETSSHFEDRVKQTLVEDDLSIIPDVPRWISGLEVFDAAAVAFFYKNPQHILLGVGPNTISIPSSDYLSDYNRDMYHGKIDSIPHMGIIQFISRSGLVGLFIIGIGINRMIKKMNKINIKYKHLFICILIFNTLNMGYFFYIFIGLFSGLVSKEKNKC